MKMFSLLWLASFFLWGCSHNTSHQEDIVGEVSATELLAQYPSFQAEYQAYQPSEKELAAVAALTDKTLVVLFGTWCHDSQREVPRLLKTFDLSGLDVPQLTLIAVDVQKSDPAGFARTYALEYTPTLVLLDQGKEVGRVVERPNTTLTQDLQALVLSAKQP